MPGVNLGHSLDTLVEIGSSYSTTQRIKVFAGYAGWSAGQLDDEMKRDTWVTHPASVELIFGSQPEKLWQTILEKKGWKFRLIADAPEDLSWN